MEQVIERFLANVVKQPDGCWVWQGRCNNKGYAYFYPGDGGKGLAGHRFAYTQFVGAIPEGMELHHTCRRRDCVNPEHLEACTHAENIARIPKETYQGRHWFRGPREPQGARLPEGGMCKRGHAISEETIYTLPNGARMCWPCKRLRQRNYKRNKAKKEGMQ